MYTDDVGRAMLKAHGFDRLAIAVATSFVNQARRGIKRILVGGPSNMRKQPRTITKSVPKSSVHTSKTSTIAKEKKKESGKNRILHYPGMYRGKFKRPKRKSRGSVKFPVSVKSQGSVTCTDADTAYLLHITHPPKYMLRVICMSMLHKYAMQSGVKIQNWQHPVPGTYPFGTTANPAGFKCQLTYQKRIGDASSRGDPWTIDLYNSAATGVAWLAVADAMAGNLATINQYSNDFHATQITWTPSVATTEIQWATKVWDADEIRITIKASSHLKLQNRTVAGAGADTDQTTSIYANPLVGKHYYFKGTGMRLARPTYTFRENQQMVAEATTGVLVVGANDSSIETTVKDILKQPPNHRVFSNAKGSSSIRLEPGEIKDSKAFDVQKKSFNGWMRAYLTWLGSGNTLNGTEATFDSAVGALSKYSHSYPGVGRLIALEKVANIAGTANVVVAGERDAIYHGRMDFKRFNFTPATNDLLTPTTAFVDP